MKESMLQNIEQTRKKSDEELLEGGAYYINQENGEKLLIVSDEQEQAAREEMNKEILKTAFGTVRELGEHTDVPNAKEIFEGLGLSKDEYIKSGLPFFVELRYKCSESVLEDLIENQSVKQVVELASGFTPHGVNTTEKHPDVKYLEVDYGAEKKKSIVENIKPDSNIEYLGGNILSEDTFDRIENSLDNGPVAIFSEGLMMYMDEENRERLASSIKKILEKHGGAFFFEDNTTFNPEYKKRLGSIISGLHKKLASKGKTNVHQKTWTQEEITQEFESLGFNIQRIPENNVELSIDKYPYRDLSKSEEEQEQLAKDEGKKFTKEQLEELIKDAEDTFKMWVLTLKKEDE